MRLIGSLLAFAFLSMAFSQPSTRIWLKTTSRAEFDTYDKLHVDAQRNSYVCGYTVSGVVPHLLVVKYDPNGVKLWERIYPAPIGASTGTGIGTDSSGNVYVCGITQQVTSTDSKSILLKISPSGILLWERIGTTPECYWYGMAIDSAGEVSVTGYANAGTGPRIRTSHFLPNGSKVWEKEYAYPGISATSQYAHHIGVDANRNVYVAGNTNGSNQTVNSILKYSSSGVLQWVRHVDDTVTNNDSISGFTMFGNSNCAVVTYPNDGSGRNMLTTYDTNGGRTAHYGGTFAFGSATDPRPSGLISLSNGSFMAFGDIGTGMYRTSFRTIYSGGSMTSMAGSGIITSAAAPGLGGSEAYIVTNPMGPVQPALISGLLDGYPSGNSQYSWSEKIFGSTANGQTPYAYVNIAQIDSRGDLIIAGNLSGSQKQDAFIAKYECHPIAFDDSVSTQVGISVNSSAPGVRGNDRQASQATLALIQSPLRGTFTAFNEGSFSYTPNAGFAGLDRAVYRLTRTNGTSPRSSDAEVTFTVYPTVSSFIFEPATVKGGLQTIMRVVVGTRLVTNLTLPVTGYSDYISGSYHMITIPKDTKQGEVLLGTSPTATNQTSTFTVRSGTSTRSASITITP